MIILAQYHPTFRRQAVARVQEVLPGSSSEWAAIKLVASELGVSRETLRRWVRQADTDEVAGPVPPRRLPVADARHILRENAHLRRALGLAQSVPTATPTQSEPQSEPQPQPQPGEVTPLLDAAGAVLPPTTPPEATTGADATSGQEGPPPR